MEARAYVRRLPGRRRDHASDYPSNSNPTTEPAITHNLPQPFSSNFQGLNQSTGTPLWYASRTLVFNSIPGTPDGGATGIVPNTVQIGKNYFFTAKVRATSRKCAQLLFGTVEFHSGRHFVFSSQSLFAFAVFYQGNLEIAAGGNMTITGPISTNSSVFMGAPSTYSLVLTDKAYYFEDYNGAPDPLTGVTRRINPGAALDDPIYNPNPLIAAPPDQPAQRAIQVVKLGSQSSFINGIDVAAALANYPQAYTNLTGNVDANEVYRAVVAPPPADPTTGVLYSEDPVVKANRMYNKAALIITVDQTDPAIPATVTVGTAADPTPLHEDRQRLPGPFHGPGGPDCAYGHNPSGDRQQARA